MNCDFSSSLLNSALSQSNELTPLDSIDCCKCQKSSPFLFFDAASKTFYCWKCAVSDSQTMLHPLRLIVHPSTLKAMQSPTPEFALASFCCSVCNKRPCCSNAIFFVCHTCTLRTKRPFILCSHCFVNSVDTCTHPASVCFSSSPCSGSHSCVLSVTALLLPVSARSKHSDLEFVRSGFFIPRFP